ncbi:MAG: RnfABCDGE type electron transport complex subunit A [Oscillospiraceae bacterium]|nr:RnfABCDGE type electron transport complex subunit A [Oscillospiraceae bacterium]
MDWQNLIGIALGAILINNFIFSQFLGICPFMGVSKSTETAVGMGLAVTFVMGLASAVCYPINKFILVSKTIFPDGNNLKFMQTIVFILVIASLVQFIEMFLQKAMPSLYTALGVYLPLITTNCAVLGVVLQNVQNEYTFIESVTYGVTGGLGFLLAIFLFASVRERLALTSECPKAFEGFPIALVTAGLLALCFGGFSGLSIFG